CVLTIRLPLRSPLFPYTTLFRSLDVDPKLREVLLALELAVEAAAGPLPPAGLARVDDEPALAAGGEPVLGLLEGRLKNHRATGGRRSGSGRRAGRGSGSRARCRSSPPTP